MHKYVGLNGACAGNGEITQSRKIYKDLFSRTLFCLSGVQAFSAQPSTTTLRLAFSQAAAWLPFQNLTKPAKTL